MNQNEICFSGILCLEKTGVYIKKNRIKYTYANFMEVSPNTEQHMHQNNNTNF